MYGKLFAQMYDGTLATKGPWEALVTFQQFIILADREGVLDMTPEAISRRTTIPLDVIETGIAALEAPDPDSRTPTAEGRRITRLSPTRAWGWQIVNHEHYRKLRSEDDRRQYMRELMRKKRADEAAAEAVVEGVEAPVSQIVSNVRKSEHIAVSSRQYADTETDKSNSTHASAHTNGTHPSQNGAGPRQSDDRASVDASVGSAVDRVPATILDGLRDSPVGASVQLVTTAGAARALPAVRGPKNALAIRDQIGAVLTQIAAGEREHMQASQLMELNAKVVFLYWTARFNHPKSILDPKRLQKIVARLKENDGDVSELLYALDGAARDDKIMGAGRCLGEAKYDGIETVLRDRGQVERFSNTRKKFREGIPHPALDKIRAALSGEDDGA